MLAKLFTYSLFGIDAKPVEVEVDISPGAIPKTTLVGLAEAAVLAGIVRALRLRLYGDEDEPALATAEDAA